MDQRDHIAANGLGGLHLGGESPPPQPLEQVDVDAAVAGTDDGASNMLPPEIWRYHYRVTAKETT